MSCALCVMRTMAKYKKISKNIQEIIIDNPKTKGKIKWINISNPGKEELEFLRKNKEYRFDFSELYASSAKITAQRPRIEKKDRYFFLILHFPIFKNNEIVAGEIDFFIGHGFLITLHNDNVNALNDFFNICKKDDFSLISHELESSAILLYEILHKLIFHCYNLIDQNNAKINEVEKTIFRRNQQKKAVVKILELRRNVIDIRRILQNHKNILKKIMEMKSSIVSANKLQKYYIDLVEHAKRIWEYSESQKEVIEAFHDTNESLLNYSINSIIKTLTIFSVIVFPLTLFAAIFGMNTLNGMPFVEMNNGFWVVISIMGVGTMGMILFFIKKRWL